MIESSMEQENLVSQPEKHQSYEKGLAREMEKLVRANSISTSHSNSTEALKKTERDRKREGERETLPCVF